jgi:hypothetical protein
MRATRNVMVVVGTALLVAGFLTAASIERPDSLPFGAIGAGIMAAGAALVLLAALTRPPD